MVRQWQQVVVAQGTPGMAVNEIVLVANRNGHGHVIVRWGHGLLRERGKKRDTETSVIRLEILMIIVSEQTKTNKGMDSEGEKETIPKHSRNTKKFKIL